MGFGICTGFNFAAFVEFQSCPCHYCAGREGRRDTSDNGYPIETEDGIRIEEVVIILWSFIGYHTQFPQKFQF